MRLRRMLLWGLALSMVTAVVQAAGPWPGIGVGGSSTGGSGGAASGLTPNMSAVSGASCSGTTSGTVAVHTDLTGMLTPGAAIYTLYCDGTLWQNLGTPQYQFRVAPPDPAETCANGDFLWVFVGSRDHPSLTIFGCTEVDFPDGGFAEEYQPQLPFVAGDYSVTNSIPWTDGAGWQNVVLSSDLGVDGGYLFIGPTGVGAATWGDATHVAQVTTTTEGRLSTATSLAIAYPPSAWTAFAGAAQADNTDFLAPFKATVGFKVRNVSVSWGTSGVTGGGTDLAVIAIYDVTGSAELCHCTLGILCTAATNTPSSCDCNSGDATAGHLYTARWNSGTTCSTNPAVVAVNVETVLP